MEEGTSLVLSLSSPRSDCCCCSRPTACVGPPTVSVKLTFWSELGNRNTGKLTIFEKSEYPWGLFLWYFQDAISSFSILWFYVPGFVRLTDFRLCFPLSSGVRMLPYLISVLLVTSMSSIWAQDFNEERKTYKKSRSRPVAAGVHDGQGEKLDKCFWKLFQNFVLMLTNNPA